MDWQALIKAYEGFLKLEKGLSSNSIEAYLSDIGKLEQFLELSQMEVGPEELDREQLGVRPGYCPESRHFIVISFLRI